ncbi:uncharacterized protein LOC134681606 [Mytilus trossulus]|uniref:uncharacterized protein LOC134681606 n=1 Tax=Mytilus trossulus TaxID=6551 RepID=UPI003006B8AB
MTFSLNDKDLHFRNECCDHQHLSGCPKCLQLSDLLDEIKRRVQLLETENIEDLYNEILFKTSNAIDNIVEWKKHIVRSKNQLRAKNHVISSLDGSKAIVMLDWAMKFLPQKFREGQTDWFGKRGVNWHIAVCLINGESGLQAMTDVHLFPSPVAQDAFTTASILCDIVSDLSTLKPEIKDVSFWSDNAGCYKSTLTLAMIYANLGPILSSYNFSEAQDGKGACDRKASHIKAEIKRYVNEGHNVLDANEMKKAIDSRNNKNYKCKIVEIDGRVLKPSVKAIPSISSFSDFNYSQHGLTVLKAYGIGNGKLIKWDQIYDCTKKMSVCLKVVDFSENITFTDIKVKYSEARQGLRESNNEEGHCSEEEDGNQDMDAVGDEENSLNEGGMLCCPVDGCVKSFIKHKNLEDHLLIGNCKFKLKNEPTLDMTKNMYLTKVTSKVEKTYSLSSDTVVVQENITEGWALKTRKPPTLFSKEQKLYLDEKFKIGETTGKKEDPITVSQEMRTTKVKGKRRFKMSEFLTSQQIGSYFSRVSRKKVEDNMPATIEEHLSSVREEILTKLND